MSCSTLDTRARPLRDLRISVTDRCNFRCRYCMPREHFGEGYPYLPRAEILSFEEIQRVARAFAALGVRKLRLTGGEPLLRRDLPILVSMLATIPGVEVALTTNGALLPQHAEALARAGLARVTVSLDSLDEAVFQSLNDTTTTVAEVLAGIDAAARAGLGPVKVNAVICRGTNEEAVVSLAQRFRGTGHVVRFIEYMDVGTTNGWRHDRVVPAREILAALETVAPLDPVSPSYRGEVARRWRYRDGGGEVGIISSVSQPFCGDCTRARLSADGRVFTCLFAATGVDLRGPLRAGIGDADLENHIAHIWTAREDRYSELRASGSIPAERAEMPYLGG